MNKIKEFVLKVMEEYSDSIERNLSDFVEYMGELAEYMVAGVKYLLTGLVIVISYIFLAVTMPIWYLPYKFFKKS